LPPPMATLTPCVKVSILLVAPHRQPASLYPPPYPSVYLPSPPTYLPSPLRLLTRCLSPGVAPSPFTKVNGHPQTLQVVSPSAPSTVSSTS
jgi:hypothetical protein